VFLASNCIITQAISHNSLPSHVTVPPVNIPRNDDDSSHQNEFVVCGQCQLEFPNFQVSIRDNQLRSRGFSYSFSLHPTVTQRPHHASAPVIVGVTNRVYCAALLAPTFASVTWPLSIQHEYRCTPRRWASIAQSKQSKYSRMLLQPVLRLISNARAVGEARNDSTFIRCYECGESNVLTLLSARDVTLVQFPHGGTI
jgi:hypothetical protein